MAKFKLGDKVKTVKGSVWYGTVVGTYSTTSIKEGYLVEFPLYPGSVQLYPAEQLELSNVTPKYAATRYIVHPKNTKCVYTDIIDEALQTYVDWLLSDKADQAVNVLHKIANNLSKKRHEAAK